MVGAYEALGVEGIRDQLKREALKIYREDIEINREIGRQGRGLIRDGAPDTYSL